MRRALAIAALAAAFAAPAGAVEVTIVPNVSIGKVKLGMTLRQVKGILGAPQTVNTRAEIHGHGYIEYGWNFSSLWVGFVNKRGILHAALIGTGLRAQRTANGVGVGTGLSTLQKRYRVTCNVGPNPDVHYVGQLLFEPGMRIAGWCVLATVRRARASTSE